VVIAGTGAALSVDVDATRRLRGEMRTARS
jgi:hypothetical protein